MIQNYSNKFFPAILSLILIGGTAGTAFAGGAGSITECNVVQNQSISLHVPLGDAISYPITIECDGVIDAIIGQGLSCTANSVDLDPLSPYGFDTISSLVGVLNNEDTTEEHCEVFYLVQGEGGGSIPITLELWINEHSPFDENYVHAVWDLSFGDLENPPVFPYPPEDFLFS